MTEDDEGEELWGRCWTCYNAKRVWCRCALPDGDYAMGCEKGHFMHLLKHGEKCPDYDKGGYRVVPC